MLQDGFLKDQSKPGLFGGRNLKYDVRDGAFRLQTESYAKVKCKMTFGEYPFDTQYCPFIISPQRNLTYQVKIEKMLLIQILKAVIW